MRTLHIHLPRGKVEDGISLLQPTPETRSQWKKIRKRTCDCPDCGGTCGGDHHEEKLTAGGRTLTLKDVETHKSPDGDIHLGEKMRCQVCGDWQNATPEAKRDAAMAARTQLKIGA